MLDCIDFCSHIICSEQNYKHYCHKCAQFKVEETKTGQFSVLKMCYKVCVCVCVNLIRCELH